MVGVMLLILVEVQRVSLRKIVMRDLGCCRLVDLNRRG